MKHSFLNRIISFMLAFVMVCANLIMPIWSAESSQSNSENYEVNVGGTAKLNTNAMIYVSDDPTAGLNFQNVLMSEKVAEYADIVFAIVDCYVGNGGYWYKLGAMDGQTLPAELQSMPWIYQNDIIDMGYADALIITPPSQPSEPDNSYVDQATGIKISGDLPEGAEVNVTVPHVNGEALNGVYDIKIYDANGKVWQPIDEGKTVTISFPVGYDKAGLTHIIDYHGAIAGRSDLTFVPVAEIEDQELLQLLGPAMDAYEAVYGTRDYVAVEEMDPVSAQNGMASFEVNSFSIYIPFDGKHQDASTDWESYQGYSNVEEAKAAVEAGTAYMYKIEKGGSLSINWSKGSNTIGRYYTISIWENGAWQRSAEPEKNWLGAYKDQKSVSLSHLSAELVDEYTELLFVTKYRNIKFTVANNDSAIDQIFYISYKPPK